MSTTCKLQRARTAGRCLEAARVRHCTIAPQPQRPALHIHRSGIGQIDIAVLRNIYIGVIAGVKKRINTTTAQHQRPRTGTLAQRARVVQRRRVADRRSVIRQPARGIAPAQVPLHVKQPIVGDRVVVNNVHPASTPHQRAVVHQRAIAKVLHPAIQHQRRSAVDRQRAPTCERPAAPGRSRTAQAQRPAARQCAARQRKTGC